MDEKLEALIFFRRMKAAVNTPGIKGVIVYLNDEGEMEAHVVTNEEKSYVDAD